MKQFQPHITPEKRNEVERVKKLFSDYSVVGYVNLENLPSLQLQQMKMKLKENVIIKITKKRFIKIALDELQQQKKNLEQFKECIRGIPALLFTKEDPFRLAKIINQNRSRAAAKPGQKAPEDITIPAGPTNFPAGPMIGELGQLGLKTEVKDGKIGIREDKVIVKEGQEINAKVADLLIKMGIQPMKIGLNLLFTYQDGEILTGEVLFIDEQMYLTNLRQAVFRALSLGVGLAYPTKETTPLLVRKAALEAWALEGKVGDLGPTSAPAQSTPEPPSASVQSPHEPKPVHHAAPVPDVKTVSKTVSSVVTQTAAQNVAIEEKHAINPTEMQQAEKFLKDLTEKSVRVEGAKKKDVSLPAQTQDITKIINDLKDKKIKGAR